MVKNMFNDKAIANIPIPMCCVDENGKIVSANEHISDVFIYDDIEGADFFALTGINLSESDSSDSDSESEKTSEKENVNNIQILERNDRYFNVIISREEDSENYIVVFDNITKYEQLKRKYNDEKLCSCRINIDNYDELTASTSPEMRMTVSTQLDKIIRQWAAKVNAPINKLNSSQYVMHFLNHYVDEMVESKFSVLDEIRQVETDVDFPMSLSIGIGVGAKNLVECEEAAQAALDLALGRGGDQAVIKRGSRIEYYGGKSQTVEKSNKGKSRVVAHALARLINQSKRVVIMGHRNPDMDCFGSALGIYRMCIMCNTDAYIVLNEISDSLQDIYKLAKETERYNFVDNKKALTLMDRDTLIIMVDTHRISYVENPELLKLTERIVVLDHHRRAEDCVESPTLSYIESYASSTAELVSEILQYAAPKKSIIKLEAEALLGGMSVDTNRFAVKTGVRTFESAAWLRRAGADTTEVKRFFQMDRESFMVRAKCIAAAKFIENGIATSVCEGMNSESQIINSQVADELLNVKGVRASFVAGRNKEGKTTVSARSLGEINVQVIMEKLGGGGHLTTAGAQLDVSPEEAIEEIMEIVNQL